MPNTRVIRRADGWTRCAGVTHIMKHPCCPLWMTRRNKKEKFLRRGKLIKSCQAVQVKFLRCSWLMNDHFFVPSPAGLRLLIFLVPASSICPSAVRRRKQHRNQVRDAENQRPNRIKRMNDISSRFDDDCRTAGREANGTGSIWIKIFLS